MPLAAIHGDEKDDDGAERCLNGGRLEAEADYAREMQERSPIGEGEESGEEAVPHGGPAPQGKA